MAPQRDQHLQAQASESLDPGPLGQRPEQVRGQIFVPTPHAAQFGVRAAPKEGRTHHPDDLAQKFLLAAQTPFDLGDQVVGEAQVMEGVLQDLRGVLRLATITCEALLRGAAATLSGLRVFFEVSWGGGHGALLDAVWICGGCSLSKHMFYENSVTSASRASNT